MFQDNLLVPSSRVKQYSWTSWSFTMGQIGCLKMTTKLHCITSQKSKDLTYTKAKARNLAFMAIFPSQSTSNTIHPRSKVTLLLLHVYHSAPINILVIEATYISLSVNQSMNHHSHVCLCTLLITYTHPAFSNSCLALSRPWPGVTSPIPMENPLFIRKYEESLASLHMAVAA